jgi:hypothetical protein
MTRQFLNLLWGHLISGINVRNFANHESIMMNWQVLQIKSHQLSIEGYRKIFKNLTGATGSHGQATVIIKIVIPCKTQ